MKTRRMYNAERLSLEMVDRISILPQPILETILCLLPIEEAARTSILSREWRHKWTTIPRLMFNVVCDLDFSMICQVLLRHQGPIHELTIFMEEDEESYDFYEFDQIILHLSKNHTVKELFLDGPVDTNYELPISIFSLHHLTDLRLCSFDVDYPPVFTGFGNLRSLHLSHVTISIKSLLHLLSNCPALKSLSLTMRVGDESDDKCTINELFKCLPMIEDITISSQVFEWLVLDSVPQELPTSLIHLKHFSLDETCFVEGYRDELAFLLALIKCSPNLEKIFLGMDWGLTDYKKYPVAKEKYSKYSHVWLDHLYELEICFLSNSLELDFVKFILARSPKLKEVSIFGGVLDRNPKILKNLLQAPRASPEAIITTLKCPPFNVCGY